MLVPLYAFVKGDTLGIVVLVQDDDTIAHLGAVISDAASMRVAPGGGVAVHAHGRRLEPHATVASSGLTALDRVDLSYASPIGAEPAR